MSWEYNPFTGTLDYYEAGGVGGTNEVMSSGITGGGALTINSGDNTKFDISAGKGYITDVTTDPVTITTVEWDTFTAQTVANLATAFATDIAIDINGNIVQQNSFTDKELRSLIFIGGLDHSNQTNIIQTFSIQVPLASPSSSIRELTKAIGDINIFGNVYGANGANLNIDRSAGEVFSYGRNNVADEENPHKIATSSDTAVSFGYVYDNGSGSGTFTAPTTTINPNNYDDGSGTLASIPGNNWSIQRVLFFPNASNTFIQYGRATYTKLLDALDAVPRADFPALAGIRTAMVRGYIIMRKGETDLTSSNTVFLQADRFGFVAGLDGGSSQVTWGNVTGTLSNQTDLQTALDGKFKLDQTTPQTVINGVPTFNGGIMGYLKDFGGTLAVDPASRTLNDSSGSVVATWSTAGKLGITGLVGIGTTSPTHTLTLPSTSTGIALYNTADQTTNYERVRHIWSGNTYCITSENGGTGTLRAVQMQTFAGGLAIGVSYTSIGGATYATAGFGSAGGSIFTAKGTPTGSSGVQYGISITPAWAQTGTAGYTALLINPAETTTGSGAKLLIDAQVGGTSKWKVQNDGVMLPVQATTASAPTYVKGGVYFDTTLNKLRVGGASGWETITSS